VLPVIEGAAGPAPAPGKVWKDPAVEIGLRILHWSADKPFAGELRAVQVYREELRTFEAWSVRLITPAGSVIEWGRPPGAERLLDPPAEKKLERLTQLAAELGGLDGKFRSVNLRAGRRESGIREVQWVFAPPERLPEPAPVRPGATTAAGARARATPAR
jgi:hypothetical protein